MFHLDNWIPAVNHAHRSILRVQFTSFARPSIGSLRKDSRIVLESAAVLTPPGREAGVESSKALLRRGGFSAAVLTPLGRASHFGELKGTFAKRWFQGLTAGLDRKVLLLVELLRRV
ncbi:uncharacterized protein LOC142772035 isoform X2 [Rhipicephalus microplus]|uniref:uncharacterized protein LOC142772035 isoform X2 n=1 Tax=Rhipicephalus microplus TaxID=6941 RepID=UPI003F6CA4FF